MRALSVLLRRAGAVTAALGLISALAVTGASRAGAATVGFNSRVTHGPAGLWYCDSTQVNPCETKTFTNLPNGTPVHMLCWDTGRANNAGAYPKRWFYVWTPAGQEGYLPIFQVAYQTPTPPCSSINWINVANNAISQWHE